MVNTATANPTSLWWIKKLQIAPLCATMGLYTFEHKKMMTKKSQPQKNIWYKNYMMIVFVIGLPTLTVMTCIFFIFYAIKIKDSTVRDDWYMDGKALYQDASKDQLAYDIGVSGIMRFDGNQVSFDLNYPKESLQTGKLANGTPISYPKTLKVGISHATDKDLDQDFILTHTQDNHYSGQVQLAHTTAKYYLNIYPENNQQNPWRLTQAHKLPSDTVAFFPLQAFAKTNP